MAEEEMLTPESGENTMLQEAIQALRQGDRIRSRDLLTRLLKTDQNNPNYWIWLSAAVDTQKERLYCLQSALQLDPENIAAKRGLILLGALPPDDSIPPFPLNHPRLWEEQLIAKEKPKIQKHGWANPAVRLFVVLGVSIVVLGMAYAGYYFAPPGALPSSLRRPIANIHTPTATPLYRTSTPTFVGPTPLVMLLNATYTPQPLYVVTKHPVTSRDYFNSGIRYFQRGDYQNAIPLFQQVLNMEPNAADVYYYIGESYRMMGDNNQALDAYQSAINTNPNSASGYLGRALAIHALNQNANISSDLDQAIQLDPQYAAAYIERGAYHIDQNNPQAALADLEAARNLTPDSPLVYLYLAQAQLALGKNEDALESARKANELDFTLLPAYLVLAQAYAATGQLDQAVGALQTYTLYNPDDADAFALLGAAYNQTGDNQLAINALDRAIGLDPHNSEAYSQRGMAYMNLGNGEKAESDLKQAVGYNPLNFDAHIGLARAYDLLGQPGSGYVQIEKNALPLADTDNKKAQVYYWEALYLEKINDTRTAQNLWHRLLELPAKAVPAEWRDAAFQHLGITPTSSPTPKPTQTRTPTKTQ